MKVLFRVECNNGSKYFEDSGEAIAFYNLKRETPMASVQLWKFLSPTTQVLVSPVHGGAPNKNNKKGVIK
ncbi:hypothetical protein FACS1894211_16730 [Clostridia bacterium]|nr:hypothetical protein FACS1894211_16730 [Clostridia bacterium]